VSRQQPRSAVTAVCLAAAIAGGAVLILATSGCRGVASSVPAILGLGGGDDAPLDESTVIAGLKEALRIGTERTVSATSAPGGFFEVPALRIGLPEPVEPMAGALRRIGLGSQVDRFEESMNRAAEHAAGEATDIFWSAITEMTVAEAFDILAGADSAATEYFRARTSDRLRAAFEPRVRQSMETVGLYRIYADLADRYAAIPLVEKPELDLEGYITDRTLDGLFHVLATEERRIREDPAARTTALLRRVFGQRSAREATRPVTPGAHPPHG
jgi:hypothetical protein